VAAERAVLLQRHPQSAAGAVLRIEVRARRRSDAVDLSYAIEGALDCVQVPAARPPRPAERLWQHTCCELFIAREGAAGYEELNFSPSGEWAHFSFSGYRTSEAVARPLRPQIAVRRLAGRLLLEAHVPVKIDGPAILGLSAVIEERGGALSYWALRHPAGKPDFHHRDAFAMELDEARD
jgi:hypothetical protein